MILTQFALHDLASTGKVALPTCQQTHRAVGPASSKLSLVKQLQIINHFFSCPVEAIKWMSHQMNQNKAALVFLDRWLILPKPFESINTRSNKYILLLARLWFCYNAKSELGCLQFNRPNAEHFFHALSTPGEINGFVNDSALTYLTFTARHQGRESDKPHQAVEITRLELHRARHRWREIRLGETWLHRFLPNDLESGPSLAHTKK